jgi:hypothetical protein
MSRKAPLLPSATVTLTIGVLLAVSCVALIQRHIPPSAPEEKPQTRVDDERDAGDEPTHEAPPPGYGHRVVKKEPDPDEPKQKKAHAKGRSH